jgi:hypothetical protein
MSNARKHGGARRKQGAGIGEFLSGALTGLGTGLGRGTNSLLSGLFGGAKKRPMRKRGGAAEGETMGPQSLVGRLNKIAKDSQIVSKGLKEFGFGGLGSAAASLGYGKRRKRGGGMVKPVKF